MVRFRNTTRAFSKSINESLSDFASDLKQNKVSIFLSHKHDENEELDGAFSMLKKIRVDVYVDWPPLVLVCNEDATEQRL